MPARKPLIWILFLGAVVPELQAQEAISVRPRAGEEIILGVPDIQPRSRSRAAELFDALRIFNQVLWDDLKFSGFFTLAGRGFYPPAPIGGPEDIDHDAWAALPFQLSYLSIGSLDLNGGILTAELRIYDMKQRTTAFGQRIHGDADTIRAIAHRWADEVVYKLTAGESNGIASTKIAYTSQRGTAKEISIMDYDGHDQRRFTNNGSLNLFPNWAPDNSKLAFVSLRTGKWEINIHSYIDGARRPFPIFGTFASTPVISPDSSKLLFSMRSHRGDSDLFISNLDGTERRNITNHPAIDTSPTWAPSGNQIAFISGREGVGTVYVADSDGANLRKVIKEGGDADSPAWSPDGKWIAFQWKPRLSTNYDIYITKVSTGNIFQLTSQNGSNETPSWAPDSRHLAFDSTRNGLSQIFVMLADGSELRMVTTQGSNTSPSWSGYVKR